MVNDSHREDLAACLQACGWKPRDLARAVNERLDRRGADGLRIHATTPYAWLRHGYAPYQPTADVVAEVIGERLQRRIGAAQLWPKRSTALTAASSAVQHLEAAWEFPDAVTQLADLAELGESERQVIQPANADDLVAVSLEGVRRRPQPLGGAAGHDAVTPPMVDLLSDHIAALRRLDDRQGGGVLNIRYVVRELRSVLELIRGAAYAQGVGRQLHAAAADLAQLAGWMHVDANAHGAGQRYLLLGLRLAKADPDRASAANILGMLSYHQAEAHQSGAALDLAVAAVDAARNSSSAMRARAAGRMATAYAAAGSLNGFRKYADEARMRLLDRHPEEDHPSIYYLSETQLSAEAGKGLVDLAQSMPGRSQRLLDEAVDLLTPMAMARPEDGTQRSSLLHGSYLARAHLLRGDVEQACSVSSVALNRLSDVQSRRCRKLLGNVAASMAKHKRHPSVAQLLPELTRATAV